MIASLSAGRFTPAVADLTITPNRRRPKPAIVYLHGVNGTAAQPMNPTTPAVRHLLHRLADSGYPIAAPTVSAYWDNVTGQARRADAVTYARTAMGATAAPVVIVGTSHGGGSALHAAALDPVNVAAVVAILPAVDWQAIRVANPLDLRASLDAAWNVAYPAPLPTGADPATLTDELAAVPLQLWTASDDPVSINAEAFAAATGAELHDLGPLGHTEAAVAAVDVAAVAAFIDTAT